MRKSARYVDLLRRYVGPQRKRAALLAVLLLASIGLQLIGPQLLRSFIDGAIGGGAVETLALVAVAYVVVALVTQVFTASAQYVGEDVGWTATNALRADLALHLLRLDQSFHKARTAGELIERIDGDVNALAAFFSRFVVNVAGNLILLVGVLIVITREDWRAGLALTLFAALALFTMAGPLRNVAVRYWHELREVSAQLYGFIGERLAGTEDIRSSGAERFVMGELAGHHESWLAARSRASLAGTVLWTSSIVTFAVGNAVAFGVGAYLWSLGAITLGTVYLLFNYTDILRRPFEQLRRQLDEMQQAVASVGRIDDLLRTESRLPEGRGIPIPRGPLAVEIDAVSFAYESRDAGDGLVLRDITLRLAPGRVLGVLGRTGSGKTTLARLLLRFYDPSAGAIRLGGVDLRDARLDDVRARATLVSQDVQLFHATVRDNVTFFDRTIPDDRVIAVIERIGLDRWLRSLQRGAWNSSVLDHEMTTGGLSAGEAQLLAFARVFLRDPGLVILDEASSRLDAATERQIELAIDALLEGRTGVVIAHRLATVERCDDICVLEDGRVVEYGRRAQLAADPSSHFSELLRTGLEQVLA